MSKRWQIKDFVLHLAYNDQDTVKLNTKEIKTDCWVGSEIDTFWYNGNVIKPITENKYVEYK